MSTDINMIVSPSSQNIEMAGKALQDGELVVMPTETVYGLAADALNATAATKIFTAKKRPFFDPLICHISHLEMAMLLTTELPPLIAKAVKKFWPGPLTVVVEKKNGVPEIITAGLPTVAIRMPSHPTALQLIESAGRPLAAPSANLFGKLSPTRPEHTLDLASSIHSILDGGLCEVGVESTIIRELDNTLVILRPGGVTAQQLRDATGATVVDAQERAVPDAPGQLPSHYAPEAPITLIDEEEALPESLNEYALLLFRNQRNFTDKNRPKAVITLTANGSLDEAATHLFEALHILDSCKPEKIFAERVPNTGVGKAIMNRLSKASYQP